MNCHIPCFRPRPGSQETRDTLGNDQAQFCMSSPGSREKSDHFRTTPRSRISRSSGLRLPLRPLRPGAGRGGPGIGRPASLSQSPVRESRAPSAGNAGGQQAGRLGVLGRGDRPGLPLRPADQASVRPRAGAPPTPELGHIAGHFRRLRLEENRRITGKSTWLGW